MGALAEALSLLDTAKVIGTIFNGDNRPLSPYSNYYGYYGPRKNSSGSSGGGSQSSRV